MRLIIVSNRLPVTVSINDGEFAFQRSAGGLVSGLSAYLDGLKSTSRSKSDYVWIGWPGIDPLKPLKENLKKRLITEEQAYPVFLSEKVMDNFYHGFCNKTIWPLFHYFPSYAEYNEEYWTDYQAVNSTFCETVLEMVRPDDVVWIHDYHLMLLPKLLRDKRPDLRIGFFLHIPFPSFEIFRLLPPKWRGEILEGLLGADLIGFHTHDYTQYFLKCVSRILGGEHNFGQIARNNRLMAADTFPMGIDYKKFSEAAVQAEVKKERDTLRKTLKGLKIILSVDRLDYSKGILNRLQGFQKFLADNPEWRCRVILLLVLVPSRIGVEQYQQMKAQIDALVGKINGEFGEIGWSPISYQYKFLTFSELMTLYSEADVALITPLRDGMNLVAKEYVASQSDKNGVLILSEMAGASRELGEAIIINPTTNGEIAAALKMALEMPLEEQIRRNEIMQERLRQYDVLRWAEDFLQKLDETGKDQEKFYAKVLKEPGLADLVEKYHQARRRLLLLDYDGTLVPFEGRPEAASPRAELLDLIQQISKDKTTEVVIISGRTRNTLQLWFKNLPIHLIAEHGVWIKKAGKEWRLIKPLRNDWKGQILPILRMSADRLPGAFVEEKEYSLVWHYRMADPELALLREREILDDLINFTANIDLQVIEGHKIVEVKNAGVSKGNAALEILSSGEFDFILAVGDDNTDEDLFRALPENAYSIRVGLANTHARFNLPSHREVLNLLRRIVS